MKLIHCADLHLDSPMGTHMTMQQASARNTQIIDSFLRLTDFARENGVRAVIIAGDLFDGTRVRSRTVDEFLPPWSGHRRLTICIFREIMMVQPGPFLTRCCREI